MRKDYIPVDDATFAADETAFVEQFWTKNWQVHGGGMAVSGLAQREEYAIMRPFLSRLAPGARILDGGCGLGEWTVFLGQQGFDTVGLDLSSETVRILNTRFPDRTFIQGDIRDTGLPAGSFAACYAWGTFEHFENGLGDCLNEVHRVLAPGGLLFMTVPYQNWRHILRDARSLASWDSGFDREQGYRQRHRFYQWRFTRAELRRELELRGYRTHLITPTSKDTGVGRWLQWDLPVLRKGTRAFAIARRIASRLLPASYISHMLMAVAERRPDV